MAQIWNALAKAKRNALLKEAGGVIKALEHLEFRTVTPRDEGGKVKNKN